MATEAIRHQVTVRLRPRNPTWDRVFFTSMIALLWAIVLYGFSRTYFLAGMVRAPLPNVLIHIHGAAFTLWMILLAIQTSFITAGQIRWHKRLGIAAFLLAVAMVILGLLAAVDSLRRNIAPLGLPATTFFVIPISDMLLFSLFIFFAYRSRFRPAAHKRLILIATIAISDAAVGRFPGFLQTHPRAQDLIPFALLFLLMAYDRISLGKIQRTTLWASAVLIVVHLTRIPLAFTPLWQSFARHLRG